MEILATLRQSGGINALARQIGQPPAVTMAAANAALPGLVERFRQCRGGLAGLLQAIEESGGAAMAQSIMTGDRVDVQPGVLLLARLGNGAAHAAAQSAADPAETRLAPDLQARLTTLLAMLLGGYLAARSASGTLSEREIGALLVARKSYYGSDDEPV